MRPQSLYSALSLGKAGRLEQLLKERCYDVVGGDVAHLGGLACLLVGVNTENDHLQSTEMLFAFYRLKYQNICKSLG